MSKKFLSIFLTISMIFVLGQTAFANELVNSNDIPSELKKIDFSKELTESEKEILKKYYAEDSKKVFNDEYANELAKKDELKIKEALNSDTAFIKEVQNGPADLLKSSSALGTVGDILVTYSFTSLGADWGATGHAAIVNKDNSQTIESFPSFFGWGSHEDGVRIYPNNWKDYKKVYGVRVSDASLSDYENAASYAKAQADAEKPYNYNFFHKAKTSAFYCSQLVWRAWKNQGYEVDRLNLGNWDPVSPAELVGAKGTYVFYHK